MSKPRKRAKKKSPKSTPTNRDVSAIANAAFKKAQESVKGTPSNLDVQALRKTLMSRQQTDDKQ